MPFSRLGCALCGAWVSSCCLLSAHTPDLPADSAAHYLSDVVVTGTRTPLAAHRLAQTVTVVEKGDFEQHPAELSVLPTLQSKVPGLILTARSLVGYGVSSGAAGTLSMRGLSSSSGSLLILIDGQPHMSGIYGHAFADMYQTAMTDHVEVLRSPASLLYGSGAMGGVINLVTRKATDHAPHTSATVTAGSYGTVKAAVDFAQQSGAWNTLASLNIQRSDNHRAHLGFFQYGGYAKAARTLSSHWESALSLDLTHFNASQPGPTSAPLLEANQYITRGHTALSLSNHYNHTEGRLNLSGSFGRHKINDGHTADAAAQTRLFRSRDALLGVSGYQSFRPWQGGLLTAGFDYSHIYGRAFYTDRTSGERLQTANKQSGHSHQNELGLYATLHESLNAQWAFEAGVRYDYHNVTGSTFIPHVGIATHPSPLTTLRASMSKGFRNPTMRELYLYPTSNETLSPESLYSYELSWQQRFATTALTYGLTAFYIHADNLIQTIDRKNVNTGTLYNSGLEVEATYHTPLHWRFSTHHSWLHQAHPIAATATYKGVLQTEYRYQAFSAMVSFSELYGLYTSADTSAPREEATLVDLTASYRPTSHLVFSVSLDNLLNERYEMVKGYPMPGTTAMATVGVKF